MLEGREGASEQRGPLLSPMASQSGLGSVLPRRDHVEPGLPGEQSLPPAASGSTHRPVSGLHEGCSQDSYMAGYRVECLGQGKELKDTCHLVIVLLRLDWTLLPKRPVWDEEMASWMFFQTCLILSTHMVTRSRSKLLASAGIHQACGKQTYMQAKHP